MSKATLVAILALLAIAACESLAPTATGTWMGTSIFNSRTWNFTITVDQQGDSLRGSADVTATQGFREKYFVAGSLVGDSIRLNLRPVEDADFNIAGRIDAKHIIGRLWFNSSVETSSSLVLTRNGFPRTFP